MEEAVELGTFATVLGLLSQRYRLLLLSDSDALIASEKSVAGNYFTNCIRKRLYDCSLEIGEIVTCHRFWADTARDRNCDIPAAKVKSRRGLARATE
jgi:hypothetical protein